METFAEEKPLVENPRFLEERSQALRGLKAAVIDAPIIDVIQSFAEIRCCYTLQSCWGHFVHDGQPDKHGVGPLGGYRDDTEVRYQIAYVALCVENSDAGRKLIEGLKYLVKIDTGYVQFCSPGWFWDQKVNTYAVQVEPDRFKNLDFCVVGIKEAVHLERVRNAFYDETRSVLKSLVRVKH